jgi:uncharacterized membrane protein YtjA (UPF0391 family)
MLQARGHEVQVIVDEAGHDEAAAQIDDLRIVRRGAIERSDAIAIDRHAPRERLSRPDFSVRQDEHRVMLIVAGANFASRIGGGVLMLKWAIIAAVVSLIAGALGFTGVARGAAGIAKILFVIFLLIAIVFVVMVVLGVQAFG